MSQTFAIFEIFAIAGVLYLVINLLLIAIIRSIERSLTRHESSSSQKSTALKSI
ncbi:ABC transporter permease, partial [Mesorhizobium sp. M2E.F.Ca.ET.209.01.1.1]